METQQLLLSPSTKVFVLNRKINFIDAPELCCLEANKEKFYNKQHSGCRVKLETIDRKKRQTRTEGNIQPYLIYESSSAVNTAMLFILFVFCRRFVVTESNYQPGTDFHVSFLET